jgi:hypothetical protein
MAGENRAGAELVSVGAPARRLDDPFAVGGPDELAQHGREPLAERTEGTLSLRSTRASQSPADSMPEDSSAHALPMRSSGREAGCPIVVTRSVTVSDQLIRLACDALTSQCCQVPIILAVSMRNGRTNQQHDTDHGHPGKHKQTVRRMSPLSRGGLSRILCAAKY